MKTNKIIIFIAVFFNTGLLKAQNLDEAKQFIENERYQSAETILEKAATTAPAETEASNLLVKIYLEQEKTVEAKKYINDYLLPAISNTANAMDKIAYARYLMGTGNKPGADEIFTSLLNNKKTQKNVSLLIAIAEVNIDEKAGDAQMAISWLNMAEKRDKNNPDIDILKGLAYRKLSDASNAFVAYQDALKKDPNNIKAHYLMGKIFTAQKNPDVYMDHFLKAYQIDSTYAPVLDELYKYYYYKDIKQARKFLEKYIANSDYSLQNDYYMTDILYLDGEYSNAIQAAKKIIQNEKEKSQPRLYKLMAYSSAKAGDSMQALQYLSDYFNKEETVKFISADFELRAQLTEKIEGAKNAAIAYYTIASEMDTSSLNKVKYATKISDLYKQKGDYSNQAIWLGKLYQWKEKSNNVDLFNWGLAHYTAKEYLQTDSVFSIYTTRYPKDIYGYYWQAQANAAIDTSMINALAIPHYNKVVEIGEQNIEPNKKMLLKAYGYLGGYEANITKDYPKSLNWFEKYQVMDQGNADVIGYVDMLKKWIAEKK
jgi:Flp pilus assembly protein TadD